MSLNQIKNIIEISNLDSISEKINKATKVVPTVNQLEWQRLELTAFLHFGMNTFCDLEWGDGTASPSTFNPKFVDCDQWAKTLKDSGFKGMILTCKHHDGFCLWPSAYTDYSVKASPYMDGLGDIVKQASNSAKKYGLKFGVYLSPWDRHDSRYGNSPKYNEYFLNQLTELLTNYGDIFEVWFDGACAEGPNGKRQEYDWSAYYSLIRKLQPNAVISIMGPDVRWVGNEAGTGREEEWSVVPGKIINKEMNFTFLTADAMDMDISSDKALENLPDETDCLYWSAAQVDTSIRPGWFYHIWENGKVKSLYELANIYESSVGANAELLLNIPPDTNGNISPWDVDRLMEFGEYVKTAYKKNLIDLPYEIENIDNLYKIHIKFNNSVKCNCIIIEEDIAKGQRVSSFKCFAFVNGKLENVASGKTIGNKKIVKFQSITTDYLLVEIDGYRDAPIILNVGAYSVPNIICPPIIKRDLDGMVEIVADKAEIIRYSLDDGQMKDYNGKFLLDTSAKVLAEAEYAESYMSNSSTVTDYVQFGVLKTKWEAVAVNKSELDGFIKGELKYRIFEGSSSELTIDVNENLNARGIIYTPIANALDFSYNVFEVEILTSSDNENYEIAFKGTLDNIKNNPVARILEFTKAFNFRYLKFKAIRGFDDKKIGIGSIDIMI